MQFARINDVMIHYQIIGASGDKPTIVFANALGTDFRIWRDVIIRLAGDFAIILYDKRGHGLSDIGKTPYAIEDHAADLEGLLDMLAVKSAYVCGLSIGGLVAQSLYQRRAALVRGLILCGTAPRIGSSEAWDQRIGEVETGGIEALAEGTMERWFTPDFRSAESGAITGYRNMLVRQPVTGYLASCRALRNADYSESLTRIAVPTLCVVGDQDGSTPQDLVLAMAKRIPGARYEVVKKAGHLLPVEQPAMLTEIIKAFVAEVETAN